MSKLNWTPCTITLGELKPWTANPRLSTRAQAKRLLASFAKFGQVQAIAIGPESEGSDVYDGHQRLSALLTIHGPDYTIDARRADRALTEEERQELVVALHAGAVGQWDWNALAGWDTARLQEWGMDSATLKTWDEDAGNLATMLRAEEDTEADADPQVDRAEALREKWGVERGQCWAIADHRLLCGDSTQREDVERVMGGEKASACITDPPWNVGWKYDTYKDSLTPEQYKEFCDKWRIGAELAGVNLFFVALSMKTYKYFSLWFPMAERIFAECQNFTQYTGGFMQYAHNPILVWGESETKSEAGKRDWFVAETSNTKSTPDKELAKINTATRWLPTVEYLVKFSGTNAIVYEPFAGSGTTIVACQNLRRRCRAIEISPGYVAVCLQRMADAFPGIDIRRLD